MNVNYNGKTRLIYGNNYSMALCSVTDVETLQK